MSRGNGEKAQLALDAEAQILPLLQRLFRHPLPAPQARQCRRARPVAILQRDGELGRDLHLRTCDLLDDPAITSEGRAPAHLRHRSARNGAPVVRRPRHDGLVGRFVAQRGLRQLDGDQGDRAFPSGLGRGHRPCRCTRRRRWARTPSTRRTRSSSRSGLSNRPTRRSTRSPTKRANRFCRCSRASPAPTPGAPASATTSPSTRIRIREPRICGRRWKACRRDRASPPIARDFTNQPGVPLIKVGPAQCSGGQTVATITQSQFSNDRARAVAANPLALACAGPGDRRRRERRGS